MCLIVVSNVQTQSTEWLTSNRWVLNMADNWSGNMNNKRAHLKKEKTDELREKKKKKKQEFKEDQNVRT